MEEDIVSAAVALVRALCVVVGLMVAFFALHWRRCSRMTPCRIRERFLVVQSLTARIGYRRWLFALSAVVAWLALGTSTLLAQELRDGLSPAYKTPPAPPLELRDLNGDLVRLTDYRGHVVVVNFWATWCPPCIAEMPAIQRMYEQTRARGHEVLAVNLGEEIDRIRAFLAEFEPTLEFPMLLDSQGAAFESWRVQGLPTTYVVTKDGLIKYSATGGRQMDSEHIRGLLQALIDE